MQVKCFHEGCQWEGSEGERSKHQRICSKRPKNSVKIDVRAEVVELDGDMMDLQIDDEEKEEKEEKSMERKIDNSLRMEVVDL